MDRIAEAGIAVLGGDTAVAQLGPEVVLDDVVIDADLRRDEQIHAVAQAIVEVEADLTADEVVGDLIVDVGFVGAAVLAPDAAVMQGAPGQVFAEAEVSHARQEIDAERAAASGRQQAVADEVQLDVVDFVDPPQPMFLGAVEPSCAVSPWKYIKLVFKGVSTLPPGMLAQA